MNLNITMGQYYPVDSFVHRLDPRTKILLTILMIVAVFMVHSLVGYALVLAFLYWAAKCSNVPFKMLMKGIKPLRIILILTFVLNLFFSNGTTPLIDWWIIHITREGLTQAVHYSLRLVFLVLGTSLMTLTTSPIALSDGIELLFARCMILNAARSAGIAALDTVYSDVNNEEGFIAEATLIKKLGFDGKSVINPRQIEPLHHVFMPSEKDLNKARAIMDAIAEANARGSGVASLKGKMIDKPVVTRARRLLDLYEAGCKIDEVEEI